MIKGRMRIGGLPPPRLAIAQQQRIARELLLLFGQGGREGVARSLGGVVGPPAPVGADFSAAVATGPDSIAATITRRVPTLANGLPTPRAFIFPC